MSVWFQDDNGNWPADMPNVLGYNVVHHSLDDAPLYTKAEADRIASGLDGAVVCVITDDGVMTPVRELHEANMSEVEKNELQIAKGLGEAMPVGFVSPEEATRNASFLAADEGRLRRTASAYPYEPAEYRPASYTPGASYTPTAGDDTSRDPDPNVSWGPDGDRRVWDETSRSWVTDPDWDGVRFDDDLAETSHAVARAREAIAELDSHREGDGEEEDRSRWLADDTSRWSRDDGISVTAAVNRGATDVR